LWYSSAIHEQSADINQGVDRSSPEEQGAGDQGMMFGYATNETETTYVSIRSSHKLLQELAILRRENNEIRICALMLNHRLIRI
jgi:S-adenosylmethionine synthetase